MQILTYPRDAAFAVPSAVRNPRYRAYGLHSFRNIPQVRRLSREQRFAIDVVGRVLPFRVNNYVIDELIDWDRVPDDPMFVLTFPQRAMLRPRHFERMAALVENDAGPQEIDAAADAIRWELNPHPAGQVGDNVPSLGDLKLTGIQHKYRETVLFFPSQGQTCHAYCTFCFRWPQFVGMDEIKFATRETELLVQYLREHSEVTDVLFTGGDPLIMKTRNLATYIDALLQADLSSLRTIRIGTKALGYWPYRFLTDTDAGELLDLFQRVTDSGKHLAIMAHFNHDRELETAAAQEAVGRILQTGAQIRTQSPLLAHINDDPNVWVRMWRGQVSLGCVPYYMFVVRDTGAQHYFNVPLAQAWRIFRTAYQQVSGLARTVRGPSMSAHPGKVQVLGINEVAGEKVFTLRMLQGRDPDWVLRPFFARYDPEAVWLDDLTPAFGATQFFFQQDHPA